MSMPRRPFHSTRIQEDTNLAAARQAFLQAVTEVAPHVSMELLENVGPIYSRLATYLDAAGAHSHAHSLTALRAAAQRPTYSDAGTGILPAASARGLLQARTLHALEAWARPYHLHRDNWVLEYALHHLWRVWRKPGTAPLGEYGPAVATQTVTLPPPSYDPSGETWAQYMERMDAYRREVEGVYEANGWQEMAARPHLHMHLRWLARYHVLRLPYDRCGRANRYRLTDLAGWLDEQTRNSTSDAGPSA